MSRFRKVESRTWSDEKFRKLSPIPPCGRGLWLFLMTGPHTGPIPGLFRAGRAGMAEELNWPIEAFDEAFREVFEQGMAKADFDARLVWLPRAIKYNKPESPNVVRSWRTELDLLPECDMKREAIKDIRECLHELGPPYVEAFNEIVSWAKNPSAKPCRKASSKPSRKAMPNQEQEQEQEYLGVAPRTEHERQSRHLTVRDLVGDGVDERHAADWIKFRMAKKAPLTPTAWEAVRREAEAVGITPAEAVRVAAENGWRGFKAAWYLRASQDSLRSSGPGNFAGVI